MRLRESTTSKAEGGEFSQIVTLKKEVKEVKPNGDIVMAIVLEDGHAKSPFGAQEIPGGLLITEVWDKRGRLLSWYRSIGPDFFMAEETRQTLVAMSNVIFPEKSVRRGETWKTITDGPILKQKITYATTFVGTERMDGRKLWKFKQMASTDPASGKAKMIVDIIGWLDPANGQPVREERSLKSVPTQFGSMASTVVLTAVEVIDKPRAEGK